MLMLINVNVNVKSLNNPIFVIGPKKVVKFRAIECPFKMFNVILTKLLRTILNNCEYTLAAYTTVTLL